MTCLLGSWWKGLGQSLNPQLLASVAISMLGSYWCCQLDACLFLHMKVIGWSHVAGPRVVQWSLSYMGSNMQVRGALHWLVYWYKVIATICGGSCKGQQAMVLPFSGGFLSDYVLRWCFNPISLHCLLGMLSWAIWCSGDLNINLVACRSWQQLRLLVSAYEGEMSGKEKPIYWSPQYQL